MQRTSFYNSKRFRIAGAVIGTICALLPVFAPAGVVLAQTTGSVAPYTVSPALTGGSSIPQVPAPYVSPNITVGGSATPAPGAGAFTSDIQNATSKDSYAPTTNLGSAVLGTPAATPDTGTQQQQTPNGPASGNSPTAPDCGGNGIYGYMSCTVFFFAVNIPTKFAYITTMAFSAAVNWSLQSTSYSMDFVAAGWETTRDVANMAFLFIIIYIAISIMVQAGTAGNMQTLSRVILVALFINFSFFGTRVVIDLGNEAAVIIYNLLPGTAPSAGLLSQFKAKDLSVNVMDAIAPQRMLSDTMFNSAAQTNAKVNDGLSKAIVLSSVYISLGVVLTVVAVAFLVASIHFVTRMALLWMLIIVSPLALVAYTIKGPDKYFSQWLHELISQAFYPFYFLGVYMLLLIFMAGLSAKGGLSALALGSFQAGAGNIDFDLRLASAVGLMALITTLTVVIIKHAMKFAEEMGGRGGKTAMGIGDWVNKRIVGGYTNMTAGMVYRNTAGRAALGADKVLARSWVGDTGIGKALRGVAKGVEGAPKMVGLSSRSEVLSAQKQRLDEREKALHDQLKEAGRKADFALLQKAINDRTVGHTALTQDEKDKIAKMKYPELLGGTLKGGLSASDVKSIADLMSKGQIDAIKGGIAYSKSEKDSIGNGWKTQFTNLANDMVANGNTSPTNIGKLQSLSIEELGTMKDAELEALAKHFTKRQAEALEKDTTGRFTDALKDAVNTKRLETLTESSSNELRDIGNILRTLVRGSSVGTTIAPRTLAALAPLHTTGVVGARHLDEALQALHIEMAMTDGESKGLLKKIHGGTATGDETTKYGELTAKLRSVRSAIKEADKMEEQRKKSPTGTLNIA